jgi:alkylation response protein AidB-like acyl-CoA dehydrogenase
MDFAFNDIQQEFRNSLRRFVGQRNGSGNQSESRQAARLWSTIHWSELGALGALGAVLPEAYDGLGGDLVDAMLILEELGRGVAATPFIETIVVAARLIDRLGSEDQKRRWLPAIARGDLRLAFADGGWRPHRSGNQISGFHASRDDGGFRLNGSQDVVTGTPDADLLVILTAIANEQGPTLFIVPRDKSGIQIRPYWTLDGRPCATVTAEHVLIKDEDSLGPTGGACVAVAEVFDLATFGHCAEATGIMASLLNRTISHLKTRTQFGQALASFQALQHRLVDMVMAYELAHSLTYKAAMLGCDRQSSEWPAAVSAAKIQVTDAARLIGYESIQMHGAMGMSLELPVGHAVRRLKTIEPQFGSLDYHLRRYQALTSSGENGGNGP